MAIINCPECNEKISSTVKQCVHCGASIVVCPECETAFVEGVKVCTECGYEFKEKIEKATENTDQTTIKQQSLNAAKMHEKINKRYKGTIAIICDILCLLAGLLINVVVFSYVLKTNLYGFGGMILSVIVLIVDVVFSIIFSAFDIVNKKKDLQNFILFSREKKISLHQVIENTLTMDFHKMKADNVDDQADSLVPLINAEIYDKDPPSRKRFKVWCILVLACGVMDVLLIGLLFHHNWKIYMTGNLGMFNILGISFPKIERVWLLILSFLPRKILDIYIKKVSNKGRRDWIKKNFPQKLETYDKYLDGSYSTKKYIEEAEKNNTRGGV